MACILHIRTETTTAAFLDAIRGGEHVSVLLGGLQRLTSCVGGSKPFQSTPLWRRATRHLCGPTARTESKRVEPGGAEPVTANHLCRLTAAKSNRLCRITGHLAARNNSVIPASFYSMRPAGQQQRGAPSCWSRHGRVLMTIAAPPLYWGVERGQASRVYTVK